MTDRVNAVPKGYHSVTPYLFIRNAAQAIAFYKEAFSAQECSRMATTAGKIMHAEIMIGDSRLLLCDEFPDWNSISPQTIGGTAVALMVYVSEVDRVVDRAVAAGAVLLSPVTDQFWGDRCGTLLDPFGHQWTVATHTEDVPPEEIRARARALFEQKNSRCDCPAC